MLLFIHIYLLSKDGINMMGYKLDGSYNQLLGKTQTPMTENKANVHKKCYACGLESPADGAFTQMAHYAPDTGNLMVIARLACGRCRDEIASVREYVKTNGLVFGKDSLVYDEYISEHLAGEKKGQFEQKQAVENEGDLYHKFIEQEVKRNRLYHCKHLPQNCLQLVYYASYSVSHAERHERIKNTINKVMHQTSIPLANIHDVAILVHYLTSYMHEANVLALLKLIYNRNLFQGSPLQAKAQTSTQTSTQTDLPTQTIWPSLYEKSHIGNHIVIIGYLLHHWKAFSFNLPTLQVQRQPIQSKQQLHNILAEKTSEQNKKLSLINRDDSYKKRSNTTHSAVGLHKRQSKQQTRQCAKCSQQADIFLREMDRLKNQYTLVLRSLLSEDSAIRELVAAMESKYNKEKEEFINKIIKLKDRIQLLESETVDANKGRQRSLSESKINRNYLPDLQEVSEKSEGTIREFQNGTPSKQLEQNGLTTTSTQKQQDQNKNVPVSALHQLVIHLPQFDPSLLASETPWEQILSTLESGIKAMAQKLDKNQKKTKSLENESKRLLVILTRKQERFVPLIHEKDQLIEKYENALWKMENGLQVQDEVLGPRIQNILQTFKNQVIQTFTNMGEEEDNLSPQMTKSMLVQLEPEENLQKKSKLENRERAGIKQKESGKKKKKKGIKKEEVKEEKQCRLF